MAGQKLLSVRETSERLELSEKKVRAMIRKGELPATRVGYNLIVRERDVERFLIRGK